MPCVPATATSTTGSPRGWGPTSRASRSTCAPARPCRNHVRCPAWLRKAVAGGLPVLGICYGHQLLAHAFGGQVADHPDGLELGTHAVHLSAAAADDPLFSALPPSFDAHLVHRQSVRTLPAGAQLLAGNAHEPHQAFRLGRCAWGVQFHPEFGETAMQAYVDALAPAHGIIPGPVRATPQAAALLRRFAQVVRRLDGGASG
ncbi:glutamine amidotransferase-related protein [Caldimonas thermodepolymerans]